MAAELAEQSIKAGTWLTVIAIFLGPILAVQAQKIAKAGRAKRATRDWVFRTLMDTKDARLSVEHVRALNMIDMAFYGHKFFGFHYQRTAVKAVSRDWKAYFESLNTDTSDFSPDQAQRLNDSRDDKFTDLLASMAIAQNYDFVKVHLRRSMDSLQLHADSEADQRVDRDSLARVLTGESIIKMDVVSFRGAAQTEDTTPRRAMHG